MFNSNDSLKTVSSKMLHPITPSGAALVSSQPSTSKNAESSADPLELEFEAAGMRSGNLSSTLQKLHLWEKKLYDEVKVSLLFSPFFFFILLHNQSWARL